MKKTMILFFAAILLICAVFAQGTVAIKNVPDGAYVGTYALKNKTYTYQAVVTVTGGKLISIKLLKAPNKAVEAKAAMEFNAMLKQNTVDAASGATWKAVVNDALVKQTAYTN